MSVGAPVLDAGAGALEFVDQARGPEAVGQLLRGVARYLGVLGDVGRGEPIGDRRRQQLCEIGHVGEAVDLEHGLQLPVDGAPSAPAACSAAS